MDKATKLKNLITEAVIPDIEDYIDELMGLIASKKDTAEDREDLTQMQEMLADFEEILTDIEAGEMEEDEYDQLIAQIEEMQKIEE